FFKSVINTASEKEWQERYRIIGEGDCVKNTTTVDLLGRSEIFPMAVYKNTIIFSMPFIDNPLAWSLLHCSLCIRTPIWLLRQKREVVIREEISSAVQPSPAPRRVSSIQADREISRFGQYRVHEFMGHLQPVPVEHGP